MHHFQPRRFVLLVMIFTAGLWMAAASMFGQAHSGNIYGRTIEKGGQVLPGVTVTLTGIGAPQVFVTDAQGQFRFLSLAPGSYAVLAELEGFSKVRRTVDVSVGRNSDIDLVLSAAVRETITVTAATPILDRRQVGTSANIEQVELDKVPTARDPWVLVQSVPGVLVDRVNVGGNKSGQQSHFVNKGVESDQTAWNLDGITISDMMATGTSAFYYDFDSFQEFNVSTGSTDPSVATPGVQINMVTRRGTNDMKGSARWFWTDKSLQTSPSVPAEGRLYDPPMEQANSVDNIQEYGGEAGGPIIRDKAWLWAAYSENPITTLVSGSTSEYQKTTLKNVNGKLNYQFTPNNGAALGYTYNNKIELHRGIGPTVPLESSRNQTGPGWAWKAEDTQNIGSSLYLTGRAGWIKNGYRLEPVGGMNTQMWYDENGHIHGSNQFYSQSVPQKSARVEGSKFFDTAAASHELKFGFGYRSTPVDSMSIFPGDKTYLDLSYGEIIITRDGVPKYGSKYADAYLGDTMIVKNLTVMFGARYDNQSAKNKPNHVGANPLFPELLPAVDYKGDARSLTWKSVSPRLGVTYALGDERKTLLRASYSRYADQMGSSDAGRANPFYYPQYLYYYWDDLNGDGKFQKNELGDFDLAYYVDPNNPASGVSTTRLDYGMSAPRTTELMAGAEHELLPAFSVGANYTYRKRTNFTWTVYEKTQGSGNYYQRSDFVSAGTVSGTLPDGTAYSIPYYKLAKGIPTPLYQVTTNRPDYYQTYNGLELTATKRLQNHWMMRANLTLSSWKQHAGPNGVNPDPTPLLSGVSCISCIGTNTVASNNAEDGYINSRWAGAVNGLYELPHGFSVGAAFQAREGYIIPYYRRVNARDGFGNKRILLGNFDSYRMPNLYQIDLRGEKRFDLTGGVALTVSADVFNAADARTVLWRDYRMYSSDGTDLSTNNWIQEMQSPRIWRVGAKVSF